MVATVYFGWHFVVDDVAGVLLAVAAFTLGRWMVQPVGRGPDAVAEPAAVDQDDAVASA
jgi:hypothetical protein